MSASEPLTVLFWNIWIQNQLTAKRLDVLRRRLGRLIEQYQPHAIGLNEVLAGVKNSHPPVLAFLEEQGYHTHFEPFSPEDSGQFIGSAVATRDQPADISSHVLGPDTAAARRGFAGHEVRLIKAQIEYAGRPVTIIVNHLAHLVPYNWKTHLTHLKSFKEIIADSARDNLIMGGDFNQFKFMPKLWGAHQMYQRRTGNVLRPTWRLGGFTPIIQANYDHVFWPKASELQLHSFRVLPRSPSDHAPLLARFTWAP
ncbi:MAG TPA: endonuclease/exonuclease/phosphatase family protein [Candidatus Saccharimonadales bacterium]|nr:endonuclease/exonuclease/phosphatase family protein [Candidatus Saccharimonadales bacterium]